MLMKKVVLSLMAEGGFDFGGQDSVMEFDIGMCTGIRRAGGGW